MQTTRHRRFVERTIAGCRTSRRFRACHASPACVLLVATFLPAGGCAPAILSVADAVAFEGRPVAFAANAARPQMLGLRSSIDNVQVSFYVNGREVARGNTGNTGRASAECMLPAGGATSFEARAFIDGRELQTPGTIYTWRENRPIIAVDIDNTISRTDYDELILREESPDSKPIVGSRETLESLSSDFHIAYVTSRPWILLEKTRRWLAEHRYPPGPVITAPRLRDLVRYKTLKRNILAGLRSRWPNLLIGIGNNEFDADGYGANGMLTLIVRPSPKPYGPHALLFRDWAAVGRFFAANRETLAQPDRLAQAARGEVALLHTVATWEEPEAAAKRRKAR